MQLKKGIVSISCILILLISCNYTNCLKQGSGIGNDILLSMDHQRYYMNQHTGQVTVLVFWATWCTVCKKEMIALGSYKSDLNNERLNVAAICINPEEIDKVKNIVNQLGIQYPVLLDEGGKFYQRFQSRVAPTTIIINVKGEIDQVVEGFNEQIMRKMTSKIDLLLENYE